MHPHAVKTMTQAAFHIMAHRQRKGIADGRDGISVNRQFGLRMQQPLYGPVSHGPLEHVKRIDHHRWARRIRRLAGSVGLAIGLIRIRWRNPGFAYFFKKAHFSGPLNFPIPLLRHQMGLKDEIRDGFTIEG
jgi:hypothetical protein